MITIYISEAMQDLPQEVLAALAKAGQEWVTSQELAAMLGVDLQKIVGAVKSLEILESYIETEVNIYIMLQLYSS